MWFCQILGWMSWHYLIATVVASQLKALLRCLPCERVETCSFRWEDDLCFVWQPLSSGLRRGSEKGQPADTVDREWQTVCAREWNWKQWPWEVLLLSQVCYRTPLPTRCGGGRTHARCFALGVLVSSGYPDKALLRNKTLPQSIFLEQEDSWILLIIGQTFCKIWALIHIRGDDL